MHEFIPKNILVKFRRYGKCPSYLCDSEYELGSGFAGVSDSPVCIRNLSIKSYKDLAPYKIGVLRDDIAQDNLREQGITTNLVEVSLLDFLAKMLE